tara:strand:- start:228 stop:416 length:189 start_codon:yes stop_codon:yes gene_type:complete
MEKVLLGVLLFGLIMLFVFVLNYITQQGDMKKIPNRRKINTSLGFGISMVFFSPLWIKRYSY